MFRNLYKVILIMMLALMMVSGSFVASMATYTGGDSQVEGTVSEQASEQASDAEEAVKESASSAEETMKNPAADAETTVADSVDDASVSKDDEASSDSEASGTAESDKEADEPSVTVGTIHVSNSEAKMAVSAPDSDNAASPAQNDTESKENDNTVNNNEPVNSSEPVVKEEEEKKDGSKAHWPGHPSAIWKEEVTKEPTCTEEGIHTIGIWCKACSKYNESSKINEVISPLGHDYHEVEGTGIKPTCTEPGREPNLECSRCHEIIEGSEIPALGHDFGEWNVVKEATGTEDGLKERVCRREGCGHTEAEVIPATGIQEEPTPNINNLGNSTTEVSPKYVTVTDGAKTYLGVVDKSGNTIIKDFFTPLDKGSNAEESVTMKINGKRYSFTRYANGKVSGNLPSGFEVVGNDLRIKGVSDNLDVNVTDHTAMSSLYEEGVTGSEYEDGSYYEPSTQSPRQTSTHSSQSSNTAAAGSTGLSLEDSSLSALGLGNSSLNSSADNSSDSSVSVILNPGTDSESEAKVLDDYSDGIPSGLLLAIDLVLTLGILVGIGVLWKLGVVRF